MDRAPPHAPHASAPSTRSMCVDRLREALNPNTRLFDRQLRDRKWDATLGTENLTSTAICLICLHRAGVAPQTIGLDVTKTIDAMIEVVKRHGYLGGLGLVLWANALCNGPAIESVCEHSDVPLDQTDRRAQRITTMETAWLVSGLAHEFARSRSKFADEALYAGVQELLGRHNKRTGIFRHASSGAPFGHRLRMNVANFADQIYSVQALSFASMLTGNGEALRAADACASRLVQLQGSLGQWWWHYDPRDGNVAQPYPVYSVHQHGMAPMALMSLRKAGGTDHRVAIELSHAWIERNELNVNMLNAQAGTIWRDIELNEGAASRAIRKAKSMLGIKRAQSGAIIAAAPVDLHTNYETRPYEWAWWLFADAIASGSSVTGHIA